MLLSFTQLGPDHSASAYVRVQTRLQLQQTMEFSVLDKVIDGHSLLDMCMLLCKCKTLSQTFACCVVITSSLMFVSSIYMLCLPQDSST